MRELATGSLLTFDVSPTTNQFLEEYAGQILYRRLKEVNVTMKRQRLYSKFLERYDHLTDLDESEKHKRASDVVMKMPPNDLEDLFNSQSMPPGLTVPFVTLENTMMIFTPATGILFRWAFVAFLCQHPTLGKTIGEVTIEEMKLVFGNHKRFYYTAAELDRIIEIYFPDTFGLDRDALRPGDEEFPLSRETNYFLDNGMMSIQSVQDAFMQFAIDEAVPQLRKLLHHLRLVHVERLDSESYLNPDFFSTLSYAQEFNKGLREEGEGGKFTCLYPQKEVW